MLVSAGRNNSICKFTCDTVVCFGQVYAREDWETIIDVGRKRSFFLVRKMISTFQASMNWNTRMD